MSVITPFRRFAAEDYRNADSWFSNDFLGNLNILVDGLNWLIGNGIPLVNGLTPNARQVQSQTASVNRWACGANGTSETGNNSGSDFAITRYSDSGTQVDSPLTINRATGAITFNGVNALTQTTAQILPANFGNEATFPLFNGLILKIGTGVSTLANDGVGNAIGTISYVEPFPHGIYSVMAMNGDAFAAQSTLDMRNWTSPTYFDFLAEHGTIGNFFRANWIALGW